MNDLDGKIQAVKDELIAIQELYEFTQRMKRENEIGQEKIYQQNLTLKHQRDELTKAQSEVKAMKADLDAREKQILLREKTQLASNRLLDQKLEEFRAKTHDLAEQETKLKKDIADYKGKKQQIEKNVLVNKDIELKLQKIKLKETQIDNELNRLKNMSL